MVATSQRSESYGTDAKSGGNKNYSGATGSRGVGGSSGKAGGSQDFSAAGQGRGTNKSASPNGNSRSIGDVLNSIFAPITRAVAVAKPALDLVPVSSVPKNYHLEFPQWDAYTAKAAEVAGISQSYFDHLIGIESGGVPTATSSTGATGLAQWTAKTGRQYGLYTKADRQSTGVKNATALGNFTRANINYLGKTLGRAPTQGETYLAHQQGRGGAASLLGNPDKLAKDVTSPRNIAVNPYRGMPANPTAREFAAQWTNRFRGQQDLGTGNATGNGDAAGGPVVSSMGPNFVAGSASGFWSMMLGTDDPVEQQSYIDSIKSGTIGDDPVLTRYDKSLAFEETTTYTPNAFAYATDIPTGIDMMTTGSVAGAQPSSVGAQGGHVGVDSGASFDTVLGNLAKGDIKNAVGTFAAGLIGSDTTGTLANIFGTVAGLEPVTNIAGAFGLGSAPKQSISDAIYDYFLRIIIVILGLIFVGVGLAMFGRPVYEAAVKAVK